MPKTIADLNVDSNNVFLIWEGPYPKEARMRQIRICLQSIQENQPEANLHLFSNVLVEADLPEVVPVRWDYPGLVQGTPLMHFRTPKDLSWVIWSEVFRVLCLWRWGGTYIDVDDIMVRQLPRNINLMAACFLTDGQRAKWLPNPTIPGDYATSRGKLVNDCDFRFGADPMTNFEAQNPFLEKWLQGIPNHMPTAWGQVLPTQLMAETPDWVQQCVNPIPWSDLLYHPYDGGHHPHDQRYQGPRISTQDMLTEEDYRENWPKLNSCYDFYLVKNHKFVCQRKTDQKQPLLNWVIQDLWKQYEI